MLFFATKIKFFFNKTKSPKGFSLIEAIVAITIIFTVSVVPIYIGFNLFYTSMIIKDKVKATGIAYEGIELILNYRDAWKNYCQIGGEECDLESKGLYNFYENLYKNCETQLQKCIINENDFNLSKKAFDNKLTYIPSNTETVTDRFSRVIWFEDVTSGTAADGSNNIFNQSSLNSNSFDINAIRVNVLVCIYPENISNIISIENYCYLPHRYRMSTSLRNQMINQMSDVERDWSNFVYLTTYIYR